MKIPFLDLITPHLELEDELLAVVRNALRTAHFVAGKEVESFEKDWADYCGTQYCIGVSSGTDALRLALIAAGIGKGDCVVTTPNTFIATTEAISQAGADVGFVDIDERTYNMDPKRLRDYLETHPKVKAVIPVHLYGQMCEMDLIMELANKYKITVIEDACQAHGAEYFSATRDRWFKAGSMGRAAAFSFYPGKNLGACGEGGAVTTSDPEIAQKVRMLRDHGQAQKYYHDFEGYNSRLDAIQASILQVKLRRLNEWNLKRRQAAARYNDLFSSLDHVVVPFEPEWSRAVYHLYVIRIADRDGMIKELTDAHVGYGLHYPVPLHLQNAYSRLRFSKGAFPVAEKVSSELLSLPMFSQLTLVEQQFVAQVAAQHLGVEPMHLP